MSRATTFASLVESKTLAIGDGYRAKNDELGGDGAIFLRAGLVTDTHFALADAERFLVHSSPQLTSKMAKARDVVVTTKGNSTGRVARIPLGFPDAVYSPHLSYWRSLDTQRLDPDFLYFWSRSRQFREQLDGMKVSTDMAPYLSLVDQRRLTIELPPIAEQRTVASILGALDDKIELNRRTNETLEAMARALFQSWFVDFDPVRAKMEGRQPEGMDGETAKLFPGELTETKHGVIPRTWQRAPITAIQASGKYACVAGPFGSNLTSRDYVERGVPVIRGSNLSLSRFWMSTDEFVQVSEAKADELLGSLAYPGDVVLTQRGTLGQVGVIPLDAPFSRYVLSQSQMKIAVDPERGSAAFIAMYFQQPKVIEFIVGNGQQAGVPHINLGFLRAFELPLPPPAIAGAFERTVQVLLRRVRQLEKEANILASLRDAMLPKLLSGELHIPDAERAVSAAL